MNEQIELLQNLIQDAQDKISKNEKMLQELRSEKNKENEALRNLIKRKTMLLNVLKETQIDETFRLEAMQILENKSQPKDNIAE